MLDKDGALCGCAGYRRRKKRDQGYGKTRKICLAAGLSAHFGRVCHRHRQRMALPLYYRTVRRRGVRAYLPVFPGRAGLAHHGHGVRRGPGVPQKLRGQLPRAGACGHQMALVRLAGHGGQLSADDVLYHGGGLDAGLCGKNAARCVHRRVRRGGGRHFQ